MTRIYHDFNKLVPAESESLVSAPLVCHGTRVDLEALQVALVAGMRVTLYQPDDVDEDGMPDCLEVEAVIRYDETDAIFLGDFAFDELNYRSKKRGRS